MESLSPYRRSTAMRLVVLFTLFFFFLLIAGGIGAALGELPLSKRNVYLLSSIVQCLLAFCIPAWVTAKFSSKKEYKFLGLTQYPGLKPFIGVMIVYLIALPGMNQIIEWNESIHFPDWASGFETILRELEEANASVASTLLKTTTLSQLIITVLVVGVLTGFSEELFFRGSIQQIFIAGDSRRWLAVWGTAVIFSAMHFQFFGFVPRVLMGAFFGYIYLWSGSLWPAIFAHALNNSIVVITSGLSNENSISKLDTLGLVQDNSFPWLAVVSVVATAIFFYYFRNYFFKTKK